jgi:TolB-like protein
MSLLAELKRRNVIRMAGLYLVGAWLIVQIAETLLPIFKTPDWVLQTMVVLLALGFIPALVFSWVFELTPEGLKRDGAVSPDAPVAASTGHRMDRLLLLGMLAVIGVIAADRWWPSEAHDADGASAPNAIATSTDADASAGATLDPAANAVVAGIAVLPFGNLSSDPENAFFAGGIYEEVLTKLASIGQLRIISRTSMEQIAKEGLEVSAIGARLGVSHVLEGSVRREGEQIRVTVQLIEAATDAHVFAENYDRTLEDVFAIQSEIALAIADQLELTLSPQQVTNLSERPTSSPAAYELYLRAIEQRQVWRGGDGFLDMIKLLEPALALDPEFLLAQVMLAEAYGRMFWLGEDADGSYRDKSAALIADMKARWPDRPEVALAAAQFTYNVERDYATSLSQYQQLESQLPNDSEVLFGIAGSLKRLNRNEEFLQAAQRLVDSNPESPLAYGELLLAFLHNEQYDEGVELGELARKKFPDVQNLRNTATMLKVHRDLDMKPILEMPLAANDPMGAWVSMARFASGDKAGALVLLRTTYATVPTERAFYAAPYFIRMYQLLGQADEANRIASSAFEQVRAVIDTPTPPFGMTPARWYAHAATLAAMAGDRETALGWLRRSEAAPAPLAIEEREDAAKALSDAQLALGNAEAAFLIRQPWTEGSFADGERYMLAAKPYYDALYGESPSYHAFMRKAAENNP